METLTTKKAKEILRIADKNKLHQILDQINFTQNEYSVIQKSVFENKRILDIAVELNISLSDVSLLKNKAYKKICIFHENREKIEK